uniref:Kinesin motor domain-containing protein n=1 Tax=Hordeum vulgare subsp. vulgare TaxID=112509 RepID=A0A8I6YNH1_HORVV
MLTVIHAHAHAHAPTTTAHGLAAAASDHRLPEPFPTRLADPDTEHSPAQRRSSPGPRYSAHLLDLVAAGGGGGGEPQGVPPHPPLPAPEMERGGRPAAGCAKAKEQQPPRVCLVATGPGSVALTVPQARLVDHRRGRTATEVLDGFSAVLPPGSSQNDTFTQVMNPLVDEFLGGKSGLLVAMGPSDGVRQDPLVDEFLGGKSGLLVAMGPSDGVRQDPLVDEFLGGKSGLLVAMGPSDGVRQDPLVDEFLGGKSGLLVAMGPSDGVRQDPLVDEFLGGKSGLLTLHKIFSAADESQGGNQSPRPFYLSMFEILSEGKGERILDLLSDAAELVLQQSGTIKGLKEVAISNVMDAQSLVSRGMLKRSTAATDANSESSRSQCIITIRAVHKNSDLQNEDPISGSVLTIADLAGPERKKNTGNKGSRLLESNFINNTSMVFGLCLRALLDHQKNQKKTLEKHFKSSMLTKYLKDYLEGRKKMTLILNMKPGEDDYADTAYLLRQASPYMKIRYTSLDESSDLVSRKRTNVSLICQDNNKKRKVNKSEVPTVQLTVNYSNILQSLK